jgi:transcriptional regulator with PAS, ATPase and Fis domain
MLQPQPRPYQQAEKDPWNFEASSDERRSVLALARRIAQVSCPVLIMGPTGVGKDVLAEDIHRHSDRAGGRFVPINCAALSISLFESEAFGHVRGAFTGAVAERTGLVELADGGTLFLDEIGELPLEAQAKLLRFLAKGSFWPVGAARERSVDVRVIAATNRDLPGQLGDGFRKDLFFRLSVVLIRIPPLDPADVRRIARSILHETCARYHASLSSEQQEELVSLCAGRPWPGGARELRNVIERYALLYDPESPLHESWGALIGQEPAGAAGDAPPGRPGDAAAHLDELIFLAIAAEARDVRDLAQRLGVSVQAIYGRLRKLGLKPREVGKPEDVQRALEGARLKAGPYLPWLQSILKR